MSCQLTLLVPGLLHPPQPLQALPPQEQIPFTLLNRFFARARESQIPFNGFHATLFQLFGITKDASADYPVAALTHLVDSTDNDSEWYLRCDPASIQVDMDSLVLMGHGSLGLTEADTQQLLNIINPHVQQDGWQIEATAIDRWYVKAINKRQVTTASPFDVLGKDIKQSLPTGPDGPYWRSIMNECQMLLHDLPLNAERQRNGLLPINSLWFWGGGVLPASITCSYGVVYGHDSLLAGLAQHAGCVYERTDTIDLAIQQLQHNNILVVMDELLSAQASQDIFEWLDKVRQFEETVMQTAVALLKQGHISQMTLLSADGRAFDLTRPRLLRWWQRRAKFRSLIDEVEH